MKFKVSTEDKRDYFKLKNGQTVKGIFRGELYEFKQHWKDKKSVLCPETEACELCKLGDKPKFRFRVNFIVRDENGAYIAKVMEQGWNFYKTLRNTNESYDLEKNVLQITRHGDDIHTTYAVLPVPNGAVTDKLEAELKALTLNDLSHSITADSNEEAEEQPPYPTDSDIPF